MPTNEYKQTNISLDNMLRSICDSHGTGVYTRLMDALEGYSLPEQPLTQVAIHMYKLTRKEQGFPDTSAIRTRNFGGKSFLALEAFLVRIGYLDEQPYRTYLECKDTDTSRKVLSSIGPY